MKRKVILASASPRRKELLELVADEFDVVASGVDESSETTDAKELVKELARRKAQDVFDRNRGAVVIGADTVVQVDGQILGKPVDMEDARRMIKLLSGRTHTVFTGVCVLGENVDECDFCGTDVTFAKLEDGEIDGYLQTEQVLDKAGAYAIQEGAARFVQRIEGCFFNVVGLPVNMLYTMLKDLNVTKSLRG